MLGKISTLIFIGIFVCCLQACSSALPSNREEVDSPWNSFEEAKSAFDKIQINKTDKLHLKEIGYDPYTTPNITILNYLDIVQRFIPNSSITMADLDPLLAECLDAKSDCMGIETKMSSISTDRYGNAVLDVLNFERNTRVTGWQFNSIIILHNDKVVYKLWSGTPLVNKDIQSDRPLGPIQDSGSTVRGAVESQVGL